MNRAVDEIPGHGTNRAARKAASGAEVTTTEENGEEMRETVEESHEEDDDIWVGLSKDGCLESSQNGSSAWLCLHPSNPLDKNGSIVARYYWRQSAQVTLTATPSLLC